MIVTQTVIEPATGGSQMQDTLLLVHQIIFQTLLVETLYERLTLTGIYLEKQSPTSCLILQTRFDSVLELAIRESLMSSSMEESRRLRRLGVGVLMTGLISTIIIAMSHLPRRAILTIRSFRFR